MKFTKAELEVLLSILHGEISTYTFNAPIELWDIYNKIEKELEECNG